MSKKKQEGRATPGGEWQAEDVTRLLANPIYGYGKLLQPSDTVVDHVQQLNRELAERQESLGRALTQADLAAMLSLSPVRVSELLTKARRETGKPLLTKGYYFDQGMLPSHKNEVIALYEAGLDEAEIARQTAHAQESVGQYIRDYERVKLLLTHQTPVERIPNLIAMQPNVARAYVALVYQYHPNLKPEEMSPSQT